MRRRGFGSPTVDVATVSAALAGIGFGLVNLSYYARYYYSTCTVPVCPSNQVFQPYYPYQSLEAPGIFLIFLGLDFFLVMMLRIRFKSFAKIFVYIYTTALLGGELASLEAIVSYGTCFGNFPAVCPSQYYFQNPLLKVELVLGSYLVGAAFVLAIAVLIYLYAPELWRKRTRRLSSKRVR